MTMELIGYTFAHKVPQTPGITELECFQEMRMVFETVKETYEAAKEYLINFREFQEIRNYDVTKDFKVLTDEDFEIAKYNLEQDFDVIVTKESCLDIITIEKVYMKQRKSK